MSWTHASRIQQWFPPISLRGLIVRVPTGRCFLLSHVAGYVNSFIIVPAYEGSLRIMLAYAGFFGIVPARAGFSSSITVHEGFLGNSRVLPAAGAASPVMLVSGACRCPRHLVMMSAEAYSPTQREGMLLKCAGDAMPSQCSWPGQLKRWCVAP